MKFFICLALFVVAASAGYISQIASPLAYSAVAAPIATSYATYAAAPIATASYAAPLAYRTTAIAAPIVTSYATHIAAPIATSYAAPLAYSAYGAGLYGSAYPGYAGAYAGLLKKKK